jgi:hypothetical protein
MGAHRAAILRCDLVLLTRQQPGRATAYSDISNNAGSCKLVLSPEQRRARSNGSKSTVLSVATQRSWKNPQDEWSSKTEWHRICVLWNPSAVSTDPTRMRG